MYDETHLRELKWLAGHDPNDPTIRRSALPGIREAQRQLALLEAGKTTLQEASDSVRRAEQSPEAIEALMVEDAEELAADKEAKPTA